MESSAEDLQLESYGVPAPMAFTGVVGASWRLYRSLFGRLVLLFVALQVVMVAIVEILYVVAEGRPAGFATVLGLSYVLAGVLVGSAQVAATCVVVVAHLNRKSIGGIDALVGLPGKKELLSAALFLGMIAMVMATLLGHTALSGSILWVLHGPLIVGHIISVERTTLQEAWSRAKELWERHMVRVFLYLFCIALSIVLVQGLAGTALLLSIFGPDAGGMGVRAVGDGLTVVLHSLFLPYLAIMSTVMYLELRARKQGLTLEGLREEWVATGATGVATRD